MPVYGTIQHHTYQWQDCVEMQAQVKYLTCAYKETQLFAVCLLAHMHMYIPSHKYPTSMILTTQYTISCQVDTRTHAHTHTHGHARTHTHTRTHTPHKHHCNHTI